MAYPVRVTDTTRRGVFPFCLFANFIFLDMYVLYILYFARTYTHVAEQGVFIADLNTKVFVTRE